jgi:3-hydroxymyristoyl/3-hydroxydecanoyl-(acyl carrier protein) dehydratase
MPDERGLFDWLPHGRAFRLVSEIVHRERGELATVKHWLADDRILSDHLPGGPYVIPGVLLAEQAAQSALLLAMLEGFARPRQLLLLGSLRCEFPAPGYAPCSVVARVSLEAAFENHFGFRARCLVGEQEVARIRGIAVRPPKE